MFLIFSIVFWGYKSLYSQCNIHNKTFIKGEYLKYNVYYKIAYIPVKAATVTFEVLPENESEKNVYHYKAIGETLSAYKWIFDVKDVYECIAENETLKPLSFSKNKKEDNYTSSVFYKFDKNIIYIKSENSKGQKLDISINNNNCSRDILSTMYYARNIDYNFKSNQKLYFNVIDDNIMTTLTATYEGIEPVNYNQKEIECFIFSSDLPKGSLFGSNGKIKVWVSNDKNKIPVKVSADIIIGTVEVKLVEAKNLKKIQ